jgi:hypothetical protein
LVVGGNGPIYETEYGAFNDNYSFNFDFSGIGASGANIDIQYNTLASGDHIFDPALTAELFNSADVSLGFLSGNNLDNFVSLSNGIYYLNVKGSANPLGDPLNENPLLRGGSTFGVHFEVAAVPEPETYALMLGGLVLVGFSARRRKTESET